MVVVPALIPVATPDVTLIVALAVLLLLQVPPAGPLERVVLAPAQTVSIPVISAIAPYTLTLVVL